MQIFFRTIGLGNNDIESDEFPRENELFNERSSYLRAYVRATSSDSSESNSTYIKIACTLASSLNMALRE